MVRTGRSMRQKALQAAGRVGEDQRRSNGPPGERGRSQYSAPFKSRCDGFNLEEAGKSYFNPRGFLRSGTGKMPGRIVHVCSNASFILPS
jgi:hypothetical protein